MDDSTEPLEGAVDLVADVLQHFTERLCDGQPLNRFAAKDGARLNVEWHAHVTLASDFMPTAIPAHLCVSTWAGNASREMHVLDIAAVHESHLADAVARGSRRSGMHKTMLVEPVKFVELRHPLRRVVGRAVRLQSLDDPSRVRIDTSDLSVSVSRGHRSVTEDWEFAVLLHPGRKALTRERLAHVKYEVVKERPGVVETFTDQQSEFRGIVGSVEGDDHFTRLRVRVVGDALSLEPLSEFVIKHFQVLERTIQFQEAVGISSHSPSETLSMTTGFVNPHITKEGGLSTTSGSTFGPDLDVHVETERGGRYHEEGGEHR